MNFPRIQLDFTFTPIVVRSNILLDLSVLSSPSHRRVPNCLRILSHRWELAFAEVADSPATRWAWRSKAGDGGPGVRRFRADAPRGILRCHGHRAPGRLRVAGGQPPHPSLLRHRRSLAPEGARPGKIFACSVRGITRNFFFSQRAIFSVTEFWMRVSAKIGS